MFPKTRIILNWRPRDRLDHLKAELLIVSRLKGSAIKLILSESYYYKLPKIGHMATVAVCITTTASYGPIPNGK